MLLPVLNLHDPQTLHPQCLTPATLSNLISLLYLTSLQLFWFHFSSLNKSSTFFFLGLGTFCASTCNSFNCHTASQFYPLLISTPTFSLLTFIEHFWPFFSSLFLFLSSKETSVSATKYPDLIITLMHSRNLYYSHMTINEYHFIPEILSPKIPVFTACWSLFHPLFSTNLYFDLVMISVFLPTSVFPG